jgi:hypothetical protein
MVFASGVSLCLDSLNCAVSGASSGRGGGRTIKDAPLARETVEPLDDFAGWIKAKRVELAPPCKLSSLSGCRMGRWPPTWEERDPQAVRIARVTAPSGAFADRDSWFAGTRPAAQSATGPDPGQNAGGADKRRNAMSGSYSDDALRDPRRYGIKNTTDKVRRPGAVRRRRLGLVDNI